MSLQSNGFCLVADSTLHRSSAAATAATAATALRTAPGGAMFAASDMYGAAPGSGIGKLQSQGHVDCIATCRNVLHSS